MLGIDLVKVTRIERIWNLFGSRFATLILHEKERHLFEALSSSQKIVFLATR
jgi:phosphopantetheinyl transferase (holo-ACP synthase)